MQVYLPHSTTLNYTASPFSEKAPDSYSYRYLFHKSRNYTARDQRSTTGPRVLALVCNSSPFIPLPPHTETSHCISSPLHRLKQDLICRVGPLAQPRRDVCACHLLMSRALWAGTPCPYPRPTALLIPQKKGGRHNSVVNRNKDSVPKRTNFLRVCWYRNHR